MLVLSNNLLISIVGHGQAERFVGISRECGATGATIVPAKGTASNSILRLLGLGDISRDVVFILADRKQADNIITKAMADEKIEGISALIETDGEKKMESSWKMITIIVNDGYADDIMETARKAGATGGTITKARGTANKNHEEHFMGITIVPEKEMIMILCENDKANNIVDSISKMDCLQEPSIGIIYTQDIKNFVNLGEKQ